MNKYQRGVIEGACVACHRAYNELNSIDHNIGMLGFADFEYDILCSVKGLLSQLEAEYYVKSQQEVSEE